IAAHAVIGSDQPLLEILNGAVRQRQHRLRAFAQIGAAKEAPRSHAYRWSSDKQSRTRPSGGSWCYEGLSAPSPKLGADSRCIASVSVSPIHKHFGCRIEDTQTHSASDRRPGIFDKPLHWRTATEIRARFSETS